MIELKPAQVTSDILASRLLTRDIDRRQLIIDAFCDEYEGTTQEYESKTGIQSAEMFGTEQTGEQVLMVGSHYGQWSKADPFFDSKRFTFVDSQTIDATRFIKNFDELRHFFNEVAYIKIFEGFEWMGTFNQLFSSDDLSQLSTEIVTDLSKAHELLLKLFTQLDTINDMYTKLGNKHTRLLIQAEGVPPSLESIAASRIAQFLDTTRELLQITKKTMAAITAPQNTLSPYLHAYEYLKAVDILGNLVIQGVHDVEVYAGEIAPILENVYVQMQVSTQAKISNETHLSFAREQTRLIANKVLSADRQAPERANGVLAQFPRLPFSSNSYDRLVIDVPLARRYFPNAQSEDMQAWIKEITRVLKIDGTAYITFPDEDDFWDSRSFFAILDSHSVFREGILNWKRTKKNGYITIQIRKTLQDGENANEILQKKNQREKIQGDIVDYVTRQYQNDFDYIFKDVPKNTTRSVKCLLLIDFQGLGIPLLLLPEKTAYDCYPQMFHQAIWNSWHDVALIHSDPTVDMRRLVTSNTHYESFMHCTLQVSHANGNDQNDVVLKIDYEGAHTEESMKTIAAELGKRYGIEHFANAQYDVEIKSLIREMMLGSFIEERVAKLSRYLTPATLRAYKNWAKDYYILNEPEKRQSVQTLKMLEIEQTFLK